MKFKAFLLLAMLLIAVPVFGQSSIEDCPDCIKINQLDQQITKLVMSAQATGPSSKNAVRVRAGSGCGSGSVCGYFRQGCLVLTNAHVAGSRVGRVVRVDTQNDGSYDGTVIMAAYSDRTLADWAVLYVEGLTTIEPVKLSKTRPTGTHYTTGSPRCVWPLRSTPVITADIRDNSPLWRWRPNSIGGQSGSGVWGTDDNIQDGLLTWSWGGLGAGQQTSMIYRQATQRSTEGPDRIPGLIELRHTLPQDERIGDEIILENGFFSQTDISTLDIWHDPNADPIDPDPEPGMELTPTEMKVINAMRAVNKDYEKLVNIVVGILALGQ